MRALSIQQPWALLVVRGIKRIDVRRGRTAHTGRIAIHASTEIALKEVERLWRSNRRMARRFAELGFESRADLKALPRGAIVGTVELVGVDKGSDVHAGEADHVMESGFARALDVAVPDRTTGGRRSLIIRTRTLPVPIADDRYAWAFARAVDFEPIHGVAGRQNLWRLPADLERRVVEAEAWSVREGWRPEVDASKVRAALAAFKARWRETAKEATHAIVRRVVLTNALDALRLEDPDAEAWLQETIEYIMEHSRDRRGHIIVPKALHRTFGARRVVPPLEFQLACRRAMFAQLEHMKGEARLRMLEEEVAAFHARLVEQADRRPMAPEEIERRVERHTAETMLRMHREVEFRIEWEQQDDPDGYED
jgi:hypothetical protein